jgi:hypothetical protein
MKLHIPMPKLNGATTLNDEFQMTNDERMSNVRKPKVSKSSRMANRVWVGTGVLLFAELLL